MASWQTCPDGHEDGHVSSRGVLLIAGLERDRYRCLLSDGTYHLFLGAVRDTTTVDDAELPAPPQPIGDDGRASVLELGSRRGRARHSAPDHPDLDSPAAAPLRSPSSRLGRALRDYAEAQVLAEPVPDAADEDDGTVIIPPVPATHENVERRGTRLPGPEQPVLFPAPASTRSAPLPLSSSVDFSLDFSGDFSGDCSVDRAPSPGSDGKQHGDVDAQNRWLAWIGAVAGLVALVSLAHFAIHHHRATWALLVPVVVLIAAWALGLRTSSRGRRGESPLDAGRPSAVTAWLGSRRSRPVDAAGSGDPAPAPERMTLRQARDGDAAAAARDGRGGRLHPRAGAPADAAPAARRRATPPGPSVRGRGEQHTAVVSSLAASRGLGLAERR